MRIVKITINNFKIYYGKNTIVLPAINGKNVCVISGSNGYGKTTLMTALVWCLYGNQIREVDEFFKDRVNAAGGYNRYLHSSMNRNALENGQTEYRVSIDLNEVELPGIYCDTIMISRSFNINKSSDSLEIYMDGSPLELVDDIDQQLFIQDYILPKELAKLFFFDAEKIVRLAEIQSTHERRLFSQAYSEVLGIKRYENLQTNLNDLMIRFRRDSATSEEKEQFEVFRKEIQSIKRKVNKKDQEIEHLISEKGELRIQSDDLQEKLLREGNALSISEINSLREEKIGLDENQKRLKNEFKDLFELAPFAISGRLLANIEEQIDSEETYNKSAINQANIKSRIKLIVDTLAKDHSKVIRDLDKKIKEHYVSKVSELAHKFLIEEQGVEQDNIKLLHNFHNDESNRFKAMLSALRTTYKQSLQNLNSELKSNRTTYNAVSRTLGNAESNEKDPLISKYREERRNIDEILRHIEEQVLQKSQEIGALENELISKNKSFEETTKIIKVDNLYLEKDRLVSRLVEELDEFINRVKTSKKKSLEEKILTNVQLLMHKKDFITTINIELRDDILDILLFDKKEREIEKEDLSKGEQQLYATALLKALVEESGIEFPVIVDSPLQKFDDKHSKNVITSFYPRISKQVVILPLKNKELSKQEYKLLLKHVGCAYSIENNDDSSSSFKEIQPVKLFVD